MEENDGATGSVIDTASHIKNRSLSSIDVHHFDKTEWTPLRRTAMEFSNSELVEKVMGCFITANVVFMVVEVDMDASCRYQNLDEECTTLSWLSAANLALLVIYSLEICVHLFAFRREFFLIFWNYLDVVIVLVGIMDASGATSIPNLTFLRLFRLFKLFRTVRLFVFFPELYEMLRGFAGAIHAMVWGSVLIFIMLGVWSMLAVEMVPTPAEMGVDKEGNYLLPEVCHDCFSSTLHAMMFFVQTLVAGDSWGVCSIPIIKHTPSSLVVFLGSLVTVELGVLNLILAVIVDAAASARERDQEQKLKKKRKDEEQGLQRWRAMCETLDVDNDGTISLEELMEGFESDPEVRHTLELLDVQRDDLEDFFYLLDRDDSGDLSYHEFFHNLQKAHNQDVRTYLMSLRLQVSRLTHLLCDQTRLIASGKEKPQTVQPERLPSTVSFTVSHKDHSVSNPVLSKLPVQLDQLTQDGALSKLQVRLDQLTQDASAQAAVLVQNTQMLEALLASCKVQCPSKVEDPSKREEFSLNGSHQQSGAPGAANDRRQFSSSCAISSGRQLSGLGDAQDPVKVGLPTSRERSPGARLLGCGLRDYLRGSV